MGDYEEESSKTKTLVPLTYMGYASMDRHITNQMVQWMLRQIRLQRKKSKVLFGIEDGHLKGFTEDFEQVLLHSLDRVIMFSMAPDMAFQLFYVTTHECNSIVTGYLFSFSRDNLKEHNDVADLFTAMRRASPQKLVLPSQPNSPTNSAVTKNLSFQTNGGSTEHLPWNSSSNNLNNGKPAKVDLSPSDSHFFEVLYVGKVKISQKRVPESLIDDALIKFAQHEASKEKINQIRRNSLLAQNAATASSGDADQPPNYDSLPNSPIREGFAIMSAPSTTPLRAGKPFWRGSDNLPQVCENEVTTQNENDADVATTHNTESNASSGAGAVANDNEQPTQQKQEDLNTITSSIAEFCRESILKDSPGQAGQNCAQDGIDPTKIKQIPTQDAQAAAQNGHNPAQDEQASNLKNTNPFLVGLLIKESVPTPVVPVLPKSQTIREDSPAPASNMDFKEFVRKPKNLLRTRSGFDLPENKPFLRDRSASIGSINLYPPVAPGEQNRTMLFQVGRTDIRLISPDMKEILYERNYRDIVSCVSGQNNSDHFGFVCRDEGGFYCLVFKCESQSITSEIIGAIRQAFYAHSEFLKKQYNSTCEHCPMLWYHRLCVELEGEKNEKKMFAVIQRRVGQLSAEEANKINAEYRAAVSVMATPNVVADHNALFMNVIRAKMEEKQARHVHDTVENRSEFLNHYLGKNAIFMKAKRSLSTGLGNLLSRRSSRDDVTPSPRKENSPVHSSSNAASSLLSIDTGSFGKKYSLPIQPPASSGEPSTPHATPERDIIDTSNDMDTYSTIMGIFLKVGDSPRLNSNDVNHTQSTWRQVIFQAVQRSTKPNGMMSQKAILGFEKPEPQGKRTREELRKLFKVAIDQTILLVRMERENERIRLFAVKEMNSAIRRLKLQYDELVPVDAAVTSLWNSLLPNMQSNMAIDHHMLKQAIRQGVPRTERGTIWLYLAEQQRAQAPPVDIKKFPNYNTPYHTLLGQLTKHQHAILIDLGRTFPHHPFYSAPLGPGQLSLYNILKAYSLVDPEVGYCQGLSFVAAVLLLHADEEDAYELLRHLLIRRGLRVQYLTEMTALQIKLYQYARLIRDIEPEVHQKLEKLDIATPFYGAAWLLTLFTSTFPIGFSVRIIDLVFLETSDILFSVGMSIITVHRDALLKCETCEEGAEYLKEIVPRVDKHLVDEIMKRVYTYDIGRQLKDYAVEYNVLREEMPRIAGLAAANKRLMKEMNERIASSTETLHAFQTSHANLENQIKIMEQQMVEMSIFMMSQQINEAPLHVKRLAQMYYKRSGQYTDSSYKSREMQEKKKNSSVKKPLSVQFESDTNNQKTMAGKPHAAEVNKDRKFEKQLKRDFDRNLELGGKKNNEPALNDDDEMFSGKKQNTQKIAKKRQGRGFQELRALGSFGEEASGDVAAGGWADDVWDDVAWGTSGAASGGAASGGAASNIWAVNGAAAGGGDAATGGLSARDVEAAVGGWIASGGDKAPGGKTACGGDAATGGWTARAGDAASDGWATCAGDAATGGWTASGGGAASDGWTTGGGNGATSCWIARSGDGAAGGWPAPGGLGATGGWPDPSGLGAAGTWAANATGGWPATSGLGATGTWAAPSGLGATGGWPAPGGLGATGGWPAHGGDAAIGGRTSGGAATRDAAVGGETAATLHPLSDCDVDIKYDGQLTELKKFRPYNKGKHTVDIDDPNNNNNN